MQIEKAIETLAEFQNGFKIQFYSGQSATIHLSNEERAAIGLAVKALEEMREREALREAFKRKREARK